VTDVIAMDAAFVLFILVLVAVSIDRYTGRRCSFLVMTYRVVIVVYNRGLICILLVHNW